ncbi:MAG: DUF4288 domain-containing protein [Bacteroidia bacterium]|jgi:hypothetical protein
MNSYLAKLVFNIVIENKNITSQFDEQIRVIQAHSPEDAFIKARAIGKREEDSFINKKNETVQWKFIDITGLYSLKEAKDGEQLYSQTHEADDSNSFINYIREKAMLVQTNLLTFA